MRRRGLPRLLWPVSDKRCETRLTSCYSWVNLSERWLFPGCGSEEITSWFKAGLVRKWENEANSWVHSPCFSPTFPTKSGKRGSLSACNSQNCQKGVKPWEREKPTVIDIPERKRETLGDYALFLREKSGNNSENPWITRQ